MSGFKRRQNFGIKDMAVYDPNTGLPYGAAEITGNASITSAGEVVKNTGGASPHAHAVEEGLITTDITLSLGELPDWVLQVFSGAEVTKNVAEPNGAVSKALENVEGVSVLSATTGISSVSLKAAGADNLKTGKFILKALSATTFDVYALSSLDFGRGVKMQYVDESLKINSTPIAVTTSAATEIPALGIEVNGGTGTIDMTVGDTATFEVRSPNDGSSSIVVGSTTSKYVEVGLILSAQESSSGQLFIIEVFRAKGVGVPLGLTAKEFAKTEITLTGFLDTDKDAIYKIESVNKV